MNTDIPLTCTSERERAELFNLTLLLVVGDLQRTIRMLKQSVQPGSPEERAIAALEAEFAQSTEHVQHADIPQEVRRMCGHVSACFAALAKGGEG